MPRIEDDLRRVLRQTGEPLWASEITERINRELGTSAYSVDQIATLLTKMRDVRMAPDGRWEVVRP